ncbi:MAG: hypothetical protein DMF64_21960 [Acidobacteria bacterium]|nr:MAG: hypothetical protein DMF64_21960 [Acidobacteriota bacterium]
MLLHSLGARLRRYIGNRRRTMRRGARVLVRLPVVVAPLAVGQDASSHLASAPAIVGSTRDLSGRGLTLLLPAVRVGDRYLTDRDGYLGVRLELPEGYLYLLAAPVRFEQLGRSAEGYSFLIGARIIKMAESEWARYLAYLRTLAGLDRRGAEQARASMGPQAAKGWELVTPSSIAEAFDRFVREHASPR